VASNDDPSARSGSVSPAVPHPSTSRRTREAVGDVLAHGTVDIGFQPVVDLVSQRTVGFEALARGPIGTELETPGALFDAARDAGRLDELDWLCQRSALRAALRAGLRAPSVLFVNVEADSSGFLPLDLRALYAEATAQMVVAVELTERALTRRPGALLGRVADMRALGCVLALDDVGGASDSLPMMAVLAPEVVRLDLAELAERPADDLAVVVDAVAAHAERAGATVLVERVETPEQARLASTLGARLAQGWLFGRRESLVSAPAPPAERQVHAAFHPDPRDTTPFQILSEECAVRRASRTLLTGLSRHLEDQARAMGRNAIIVGAFAGDERFDADARRRYADKNPASRERFEAAQAALPGGNTRTVLFHEPFPLGIVRGDGCRIWDADGHEYVNLVGEYTAGLFGHSNPVILAAVRRALDGGLSLSGHTMVEGPFARAVSARFPSMELLRFTNSGTEANLLALATAVLHTGRRRILVFDGGYHGSVLSFHHSLHTGGEPLNVPHDFVVGVYNDRDGAAVQRVARKRRAVGVGTAECDEHGARSCLPGVVGHRRHVRVANGRVAHIHGRRLRNFAEKITQHH